jgi:putative ABC transport system permease protein
VRTARWQLAHGLFLDARYAIRLLVNAPGFTLTAVLTLALGIGANVAMFSVAYGVLLRPLPYRDAGQLAVVRAEVDYVGAHRPVPISIHANEVAEWPRSFESIASTAFHTASDVVALSSDSGSEILQSAVVSGGFFSTMAGRFAAGRPLNAADDTQPAAVISERLAQRLFGGATDAIGERLLLTRQTYTVVGVADRAFQFPAADVDVWLPAGFVRSVNPRCCDFQLVARLEPDGTVERTREAVHRMFVSSVAARGRPSSGIRTTVVRLPDAIVSAVRPALLVLLASVLMVLAVACGNLINLLLSRNAARDQEFAIRRALGASESRLMRQLLVESAILGVVGAGCGAVVARLSLTMLSRVPGDALPRIDAIRIDGTALLFAACLAVLATVVTGIAPAWRAVRTAAVPHPGSPERATPWRARRLQRAMCVVQVALAMVLLTGATLMGRSLLRLLHVDLGVSTDHVLAASVNLAFGERPSDARTRARIDRVIDDMRTLPGVRAVGAGTSLPPSLSRMRVTLRRHGDVVDYQAAAVPATPGYFSALQMRLLRGRLFTDADDEHHPPVMIMSEDTARRFFGPGDPIGRTLSLPVLRDGTSASAEMTLVGVTANVRYAGLAARPDDVVYRPFAQQPWVAPFLVVRTSGDPADFAQTLRRRLAAVDKGIVVGSVTTLDQLVADAAAQPRFRTVLLVSLAVLALGIAVLGLYGVVAYAVSRRTREIGIRLALGATSRQVRVMVLSDGLGVGMAGIVAGTAGGLLLARVLAGLLYGIAPTDPVSFLLASTGLLGLTLLASYLPAKRAARIDPSEALRAE